LAGPATALADEAEASTTDETKTEEVEAKEVKAAETKPAEKRWDEEIEAKAVESHERAKAQAAPAPAPAPASEPLVAEGENSLPKWVFVATLGGAVAAAVIGVGFGLSSWDLSNQVGDQDTRSASTNSAIQDMRDTAGARASTANVFYGMAAGLALASLVEFFFVDWDDGAGTASVTPTVGPNGAGAVASFRFGP